MRISNNTQIQEQLFQTNLPSIQVKSFDPDKAEMVSYELLHSEHSCQRAKERRISDDVISEVIEWGSAIHRQGYDFYVVKNRTMPDFLDEKFKTKICNLVVVMKGNRIITCYTRRDAMRYLKRKIKMLL